MVNCPSFTGGLLYSTYNVYARTVLLSLPDIPERARHMIERKMMKAIRKREKRRPYVDELGQSHLLPRLLENVT